MIAKSDMVLGGPESVFVISLVCFLIGVAVQKTAKAESQRFRLAGRILTYLGGAVAALSGIILLFAYA
jgi:hypothetical protein